MPRASRRTETPPQQHLVPDVLAPGLDLVFCGTAPSPISFKRRAYYANPGNSFWPTLHRVGLLPERFEPERYAEVLRHGIGLTDLNKTEYGSDHELSAESAVAAGWRRTAGERPELASRRQRNRPEEQVDQRHERQSQQQDDGVGRQLEHRRAAPPGERPVGCAEPSGPKITSMR